jgi:hypothetical protein
MNSPGRPFVEPDLLEVKLILQRRAITKPMELQKDGFCSGIVLFAAEMLLFTTRPTSMSPYVTVG